MTRKMMKCYLNEYVRTYIFCGYCGVVKRNDYLENHCKNDHNAEFKALKPDEDPITPFYVNWKEVAHNYPNTKPVRDFEQ